MNSDPQALKREVANDIFNDGAFLTRESEHPLIKERPKAGGDTERGFWLKMHDAHPERPLSPYYFMLRTPDNPKAGTLKSETVKKAAHAMAQLTSYHGLDYDAVAGIPNAGDPFAKAFAEITHCEFIELHKDVSGGGRKIVSGSSKSRAKVVLLIDDLITGADTKLEAVEALKGMGHEVHDLVVLIDREQGGTKKLNACGIGVYPVFKTLELLDTYVEINKLTPEFRDEINDYMATYR